MGSLAHTYITLTHITRMGNKAGKNKEQGWEEQGHV